MTRPSCVPCAAAKTMANPTGRLQLAEFCFRLAQLVRVQAVGLGEHRAARRLDGVCFEALSATGLKTFLPTARGGGWGS